MTDHIAKRIDGIIALLAAGRFELVHGDADSGRARLKDANMKLTALRVALDELMGPRTLPRSG